MLALDSWASAGTVPYLFKYGNLADHAIVVTTAGSMTGILGIRLRGPNADA
jgi:hypothetical protein